VELILREYPQFSLSHHRFRGDRTVVIKREGLLEIVRRLKEDKELDFKFLMDVTAADYPDKNPRFEVVYNLYSFKKHLRLRLKVPVGIEDPYVDSLTPLYESANWHEREVMEFFGIKFRHHPDPRKLFLYDEFKGYPLRKDYPYNKRQPLIEYRDIGIESHHYPGMRGSGVDIKKED
jgi:NADH-quinone oxidoreductase subunit C